MKLALRWILIVLVVSTISLVVISFPYIRNAYLFYEHLTGYRRFIQSHLTAYNPNRDTTPLTWLTIESVAYYDAVAGNRDWGCSEYCEFLESQRSFLIPLDDICIVEIEDVRDIEGKYAAIVVLDGEEVTGFAMMEFDGRQFLGSGVAPRGLYEDALALGIDIEVFYLVRSLHNLTQTSSQTMCDAYDHGISWTYQGSGGELSRGMIEINPVYEPVLEAMTIDCDEEIFSWNMEGPDGVQRYCAYQIEGAAVRVLYIHIAYMENRDLEGWLEEIRCTGEELE